MEEAKSVPNRPPQIPKPPNPTPQNLQTSQPPPPPAAPRPPTHHKKRKADNGDTQPANYFKLRALVKDLRPHFMEVLRTPDFRNSKAAHEIRKKMKRVMDVCKQMAVEVATVEMSLPGENKDGQKLVDKHAEEKQGKRPQPDRVSDKPLEPPLVGNISEKLEDGQLQGSYVVGGSNFGWNFIMYPGNKAVYYGVTKESRRQSFKEKMGTSDITPNT